MRVTVVIVRADGSTLGSEVDVPTFKAALFAAITTPDVWESPIRRISFTTDTEEQAS
jgi:hypothetical protein